MGDGKFVHAVLNAVASIDSYGQLGALGCMIGLVLMVMRGVMTPSGPQLNLGPVLASIIIFWIMFIPRVDRVIVSEVMPAPGNEAPRTFVVDNVPFGLAAVGYMVSNIGIKVTGLYDTIMGRATDNTRVGTGGLGRNLMLISSLQTMIADPRFSDAGNGSSEYSNYRRNMLSFLKDCVLPPVQNGHLMLNTVVQRPIEDGLFNEAFAGDIRPTTWTRGSPGGVTTENMTCGVAQAQLRSGLETNALPSGFDNAATARGSEMTSREIMDAFAAYTGENGLNAQRMMASHMVSSLLSEAVVRGSLSPQDAQAVTMLEEASLRRSISWAAEENLFIRVARPMLGFFEALFYALGPIMAFVITLGPSGWGLVVKYMMLTVWVALWFPMLSIANLYSNMRMEAYFEQLGSLNGLSPHQLEMLSSEAISTLGATSALVAATPALAMSLIYGGAVSMSHLAGRLNHGDVVDETKMVPQASTVGAVVQGGAATTFSQGAGALRQGASEIQLSSGQALSSTAQSAQALASQKTVQAQQDVYQAVDRGFSFTTEGGTFGRTSESVQASNQLSNALSEREGMSTRESEGARQLMAMSKEEQALVQQAHAYAKQNGVSMGIALNKIVGVGASTSRTTTDTETASQSGTSAFRDAIDRSESVEKALDYAVSKDQTLQSSVARATVAEAGSQLAERGSAGLSTTDGERLSRSVGEAQSASSTFTAADSLARQVGSNSTMSLSQLQQGMRADSTSGGLQDRLNSLVDAGGSELSRLRETNQAAIQNSGFVGTNQERAALASFMTLSQNPDLVPSHMRSDVNNAVVETYGRYSTFGGTAGQVAGADAMRNSGVGAAAAASGGALAATAGLGGSGTTAAAVQGMAGGAIGGARGGVASSSSGLGQQASDSGITSSAHRGFDSEHASKIAGGEARYQSNLGGSDQGQMWNSFDQTRSAQAQDAAQAAVGLNAATENMTNTFGMSKLATASDWAETVNTQTATIESLRQQGMHAEADTVAAARTDAIGSMMGSVHATSPLSFGTAAEAEIGDNSAAARGALINAGFSESSPEVQHVSALEEKHRMMPLREAQTAPTVRMPDRPRQ